MQRSMDHGISGAHASIYNKTLVPEAHEYHIREGRNIIGARRPGSLP